MPYHGNRYILFPAAAGTIPSVRDVGAFAAAGNAALNTVVWPNGTPEVSGTLGILVVTCAGDVTIGTPTDWTAGPAFVDTASASYKKIMIFYRVATSGSEADVTFTPSSSSSQAFIITLDNAGAISQIRTHNGVVADVGVVVIADASTVTNNSLVMDIITAIIDAAGQQTTVDLANASLSSYTIRMDDGSLTGAGGALSAATGGRVTAGTIGVTTATWGSSVRNTGLTIAIAPV